MAEESKNLLREHEHVDVAVERNDGESKWTFLTKALLAVCTLLLLTNITTAVVLTRYREDKQPDQLPSDWARVDELPTKWVRFRWDTPWGSNNDTEADILWDNIRTSHGHLAVDHAWAAEQHWPESMSIPGGSNKGLYLFESYHQLHCLKIVRKTLLETARGAWPTYPITHARHCVDTLRQYIMCHADNTPLYTFGDHRSGDGQLHQCRDWSALRDAATEKTACFRDGRLGDTLADHFGHCDDGKDGLEDSASQPLEPAILPELP
ncbi:hypothetical protein PVAG01_00245 [Phlyctema vagabunda]|uniref:Uncharacterized protein n=1 Tax=Phlyctema vagabunda TaxID=108571 RepID=A0ABR4PTT5_9HELO